MRTCQTLAGIAAAFDSPPTVLFERALYGASADALLRRLHALGDDAHSVMLIGHSSGIEDLALLLAGSGDGLARVREKFPTGALATLRFEGRWRRLRARDATLTGFVAPRSLAER